MKKNLILFLAVALIFVMTVAFSACTSKDIPMPDSTTKSTSTESVTSASQTSDDNAGSSASEDASQSSSKKGGLVDGGDFSAHF